MCFSAAGASLPPHTIILQALGGRTEGFARMDQPSNSDALALARHAAASWIQQALKQHFTLARAMALASERT